MTTETTTSPKHELLAMQLEGRQEPTIHVEAAGAVRSDAAQVAIEVADAYGIGLGDAQRTSIRTGCAETEDFKWASRTHGVAKCRQAGGKNNEVECREVLGMTELGEMLHLHTAHEFPTANEAFLRLELTLESYDDLRRLVDRPRYANDEKGFDFKSGGRIRYRSRTKKAGKGFAEADLIVLDEAQEILTEHMRALGPIGTANPNSQVWACGTAGYAWSEWWWRQRLRALNVQLNGAEPGVFSFVEHTAQDVELKPDGKVKLTNPEDLLDPSVLVRALPRLGDGLVTMETILEMYERDGPEVFASEFAMLWEPMPEHDAGGDIDPTQWALLAEQRDGQDEFPQIVGNLSLGFAVSKDGRWSTYAVAGVRADGLIQVEVIDRRPGDHWVGQRGAELTRKYGPVRVRSTGPSATLISTLREAGARIAGRDGEGDGIPSTVYARNTGLLLRKVTPTDGTNPTLRHLNDPALNVAVKDGRTRATDGGGKMWDITATDTDLSPLEAVTLAVGGVPQATEEVRAPIMVMA